MTLPIIYINFVKDKVNIFNFGVLTNYYVRSNQWKSDFPICNSNWFDEWLQNNGITYFAKNT